MSNVSDAYDALVARLAAVLTTHKQLPNVLDLERNTTGQLRKGYGVTFGPSLNLERETGKFSEGRDMIVVITREYHVRKFDETDRTDVQKLLVEDAASVKLDIENDPTLADNSVVQARFVSDSGVDTVAADSQKFLKIELVVNVQYDETVNC